MAYRTPRDEREWRAMVERGLRDSRSGLRAAVEAAVGTLPPGGGGTVDTRHPTAPIELTYQTSLYLSPQRQYQARFILDFPDVTKATDGTDIAVEHYELWAKPVSAPLLGLTTDSVTGLAAPGVTLPGLAATPANVAAAAVEGIWTLMATSLGSFFRTDGFEPGSLWEFRARAIGVGMATPGNWSTIVQVQMVADSTPPSQPTAPILSVDRGTITARWDGMAVTGAMPADFRYVILAHGTGTSPTQEIARFGRGGGFKVVADIPYYDPQFFRLKAVDESGNESPWSEQAVAYVTPLVDADIILSTIDAAQTHLKNIDAGVSILPNSIITEHLVVTEEMTAALANFLYIKSDKIDVNSLAADDVFTGLLDAKLVRSDMFEGKAFMGGVFTTTYGGVFQTDVEDLVGVKLSAKGLDAWSDAGVRTMEFDTATGNLSIFGGVFTGGKFQTHASANTGIKLDAPSGLKSYNFFGELQFDLSATGAVFTGRVTSGFDPDLQAVLSDSVFSNRPGVQFNIGLFDSIQPFVTGWATHAGFPWGEGMLHLSSGRTEFDDPAEVYLSRNGTWQIGRPAARIYSAGNFIEVVRDDSYLRMHGDYTSLAYGVGASQAFITQTFGHTLIHSSGVTIEGAVTIQGSLAVTASKNFVMDHPTKPGKQLLHASTESPVSGVEYWGNGTLGANGSDVFHLPEYFSALVKADSETVAVYGNGAVVGWGAVIDNAVTVTGPAGTPYSWIVKAERAGGDFAVERAKPPRPAIDGLPSRPAPPLKPEPPFSRRTLA